MDRAGRRIAHLEGVLSGANPRDALTRGPRPPRGCPICEYECDLGGDLALNAERDPCEASPTIWRSPAGAPPPRVAVLGAGVVGLTTALRFLERFPGADVTIMADKFNPDTTGDGAAGLWKPYAISDTPGELVARWGRETFEHYVEILRSPAAAIAGTSLGWAYNLLEEDEADPEWKDAVPRFHRLNAAEIRLLDVAGKYSHGYAFTTIVAEGKRYLRWLQRRVHRLGALFVRRRLEAPGDIGVGYDLVFNCLGLEGGRVFDDPLEVYPIRGQVIRVRAPWIKNTLEFGHGTYIIPNQDTVVIGGTTQRGDGDTRPREADTESILARACEAVPSLRDAQVVSVWAGLRPGRSAPRLELATVRVGAADVKVVHNYGHGGSGLTIGYGTAGDAVNLATKALGL